MWLAYQFQAHRSRSTDPLMFTHTYRAPYLPNGVYELQTWYTDEWRRPASATGACMTSKVKGQGRKVTRSVWAVLAQCCTCVIRCRRGHAVSAEPGGHTSCFYLRQLAEVVRSRRLVCHVILSGPTCIVKVISWFHWNLVSWLDLPIGRNH